MTLAAAILRLFPQADSTRDFIVADDGAGPRIAAWNLPAPQPTAEQLAAAMAAPEPAPESVWSPTEFLDRFTPEEQVAIFSCADPRIRILAAYCTGARDISSTNPRTLAGLDYLVKAGILTAKRRAEILA